MQPTQTEYDQKDLNSHFERSNSWYKSVVDASPSGILIMDKEGKIMFCSRMACNIFGVSEEKLINRSILEITHKDQREDLISRTRSIIQGDAGYDRSPMTIVPGNGAEINIEGSATIHRNEKGEKEGIIMIFNDVTERVQQAKIIHQQIQDLNAKNEELKKYIDSNLQLENFAYIASHDLKAPIRSVISFAQLLTDSTKSKLSDKEQKFLQIISDSSEHMRELIDDLLIFSRVNTTKTIFDEVDVQEMVDSILADLQQEVLKYEAEIIVTDLPKTIIADKIKIRQVFQNLIANAMKFQDDGIKPIVRLSGSENKSHWLFTVSDNGIGIDSKHIDKIFLLFQKLHSKDKFEGSGMGLAISKKVLEQHEGTISARNNEDRGCTIGFTVYKNLKESS